ncbi:MAG: hypothetical protein EXR75_05575 [Myxococcales bacterium]|nr:hypothetical protein [Myxococcales bacterium]
MPSVSFAARLIAIGAVFFSPTVLSAAHTRAPGAHHTRDDVLTLAAPVEGRARITGGLSPMGSSVREIAAAQERCRNEYGHESACPATRYADEWARHNVRLRPFYIDRTEVTVAAYLRCARTGACKPLRRGPPKSTHSAPEHPVTLVSWHDADAFCSYAGGRLPSEAEWERAARGMLGRTFPWGEIFDRRVSNHGRGAAQAFDELDDSDGFAELAPVASFVAGATNEGVFDLAGNVAEWVSDWYQEGYADADQSDPRGPAIGTRRVIRGGSYRDPSVELRGAARSATIPTLALPWLGFRCARDAR